MGFDQQFLEKTMKNMIFHDFLAVWGLALGSLMILRVWEPRAGKTQLPTLDDPSTRPQTATKS